MELGARPAVTASGVGALVTGRLGVPCIRARHLAPRYRPSYATAKLTANRKAALSRLAEQAGFSLSDVAFVSGLDESTISRLWNDRDWLDRVTGASLQKLIATVPRVAEYVTGHSLAIRRQRLIDELDQQGLTLSTAGLAECKSAGVPQPYIGNALEAAIRVMRGDVPGVIGYLARFWGRDQDQALKRLYSPPNRPGLLADQQPLLKASVELAPNLARRAYSFHSILAQATVIHHIQRATGHSESALVPTPDDRRGAFTLRSSTMGLLLDGNDIDLSERYQRTVQESSLLLVIEDWSFPTFMRDALPNSDFALPNSVLLRNTARELIRAIEQHGDAYLHYLLSTYLPVALERDPTLGLSLKQVADAVRRRLDRTSNPKVRRLCESVLVKLDGAVGDE